jgi:hypothetical protein
MARYVQVGAMPLGDNAANLIRANLEDIRDGKKPRPVVIDRLTETQLSAINADRLRRNFAPIVAEVTFVGRHIYESRCERDGYTIEDVILQITSAMDGAAVVQVSSKMTLMKNLTAREDGYGNQVTDKAVFECTSRHPRPELFSVIPSGDRTRPA